MNARNDTDRTVARRALETRAENTLREWRRLALLHDAMCADPCSRPEAIAECAKRRDEMLKQHEAIIAELLDGTEL